MFKYRINIGGNNYTFDRFNAKEYDRRIKKFPVDIYALVWIQKIAYE
jgi:hypothetical protein